MALTSPPSAQAVRSPSPSRARPVPATAAAPGAGRRREPRRQPIAAPGRRSTRWISERSQLRSHGRYLRGPRAGTRYRRWERETVAWRRLGSSSSTTNVICASCSSSVWVKTASKCAPPPTAAPGCSWFATFAPTRSCSTSCCPSSTASSCCRCCEGSRPCDRRESISTLTQLEQFATNLPAAR